jgi:hypothetical protein
MSWSIPTQPNQNDYNLFVLYSMGIDPLYLPNVPAPSAPALALASGGFLPAGPVYVTLTYVSATGETQASPESSITATVFDGSVIVTSPTVVVGATGYNVYASTVSGEEVLQNGSPVAISTPYLMGILVDSPSPPTVNTAGSPWLGYAFTQALGLVLSAPQWRNGWAVIPPNMGIDYTLAVYNCAGHIQIKITPDQVVNNISRDYFKGLRKEYGLLNLSVGLVQSTSDNSTSSVFAVSDSMKQLTLTDLDFIRTPWGRAYMQYAQDAGPTVWGLS